MVNKDECKHIYVFMFASRSFYSVFFCAVAILLRHVCDAHQEG